MPTQTITEFDSWSIANSSIQFIKAGTQVPGTKFGSVGTISFEPETTTLQKKKVELLQKKR